MCVQCSALVHCWVVFFWRDNLARRWARSSFIIHVRYHVCRASVEAHRGKKRRRLTRHDLLGSRALAGHVATDRGNQAATRSGPWKSIFWPILDQAELGRAEDQ